MACLTRSTCPRHHEARARRRCYSRRVGEAPSCPLSTTTWSCGIRIARRRLGSRRRTTSVASSSAAVQTPIVGRRNCSSAAHCRRSRCIDLVRRHRHQRRHQFRYQQGRRHGLRRLKPTSTSAPTSAQTPHIHLLSNDGNIAVWSARVTPHAKKTRKTESPGPRASPTGTTSDVCASNHPTA